MPEEDNPPWAGMTMPIKVCEPHRNPYDRLAVVKWASALFQRPESWVILDTESTSKDPESTLVQLSVIDGQRELLMNTFVQPPKGTHVPPEFLSNHSLERKDLSKQPTREQVGSDLQAIVRNKHVVTYNLEWRMRLLRANGVLPLETEGWSCAMLQYAKFAGYWNTQKQDYRYLKLPKPVFRFDALQDCAAVHSLMKAFADYQCEIPTEKAPAQERQFGWIERIRRFFAGL